MPYKYESVLKTFEYSEESLKIISDFLLSGDKKNPEILLKTTAIAQHFGKRPNDWFANPSSIEFIKSLIEVKIKEDKKFIKFFKKFLKNNEIPITRKSGNGLSDQFINILNDLTDKELLQLAKTNELIKTKRGGNNKALTGTWIHKDLAVKYAEWLDPKFAIWVSQKIQQLIQDGFAWIEARNITRRDYKPLTDAIEKYFVPKYPKMQENIIYGQIANYINLRVMKQKAKEIREEKKIAENELTRDYFKKLELERIEKVQVFAEILISQLKIHDFKKLEEMISNYEFN
jgi:hypothetical protein